MSVPRACFCKGAGMGTSSVSVDRSALKRCPCAPAGPCVSEQDPGIPGGREATTPNTLQASTPRLVPCKKKGPRCDPSVTKCVKCWVVVLAHPATQTRSSVWASARQSLSHGQLESRPAVKVCRPRERPSLTIQAHTPVF